MDEQKIENGQNPTREVNKRNVRLKAIIGAAVVACITISIVAAAMGLRNSFFKNSEPEPLAEHLGSSTGFTAFPTLETSTEELTITPLQESGPVMQPLVNLTEPTAPKASTASVPSAISTRAVTYSALEPYITDAGTVSWMEDDRVVFSFKRNSPTETPLYYHIYKTSGSLGNAVVVCQSANVSSSMERVHLKQLANNLFDASFLFFNNSNVLYDIGAALAPFESHLFNNSNGLFLSRVAFTAPNNQFDQLNIRDSVVGREQVLNLDIWKPMLCDASKNYAEIFKQKWIAFSSQQYLNVALRYVKAPSTTPVCIEIYDYNLRLSDANWNLHPACQFG